ncbi:hypothetical protein ACMXYO_16510 [Neptuniibacter sp. QD37_6]|uniref:hypothetical protein n=1 Tax=Neptuniibacter sp. QD37_6 TaxID=3398210 RepID=UPI0039F63E83
MYIRATVACFAILLTSHTKAATLDITVLNPDKSGVNSIVLYAEPLDQPAPKIERKKIEITQKDRAFAPHITVMQRQNEVQFSNKDDFTHHIYSISGPNRFSFKLKSGESKVLKAFEPDSSTETVAMGCNIHDWMSGFILIVDTPYFAKTTKTGSASFDLHHLGRYRLTLWHPQLKAENNRLTQIVDISQDQKLTWQLSETFYEVQPKADEEDFEFLDVY